MPSFRSHSGSSCASRGSCGSTDRYDDNDCDDDEGGIFCFEHNSMMSPTPRSPTPGSMDGSCLEEDPWHDIVIPFPSPRRMNFETSFNVLQQYKSAAETEQTDSAGLVGSDPDFPSDPDLLHTSMETTKYNEMNNNADEMENHANGIADNQLKFLTQPRNTKTPRKRTKPAAGRALDPPATV